MNRPVFLAAIAIAVLLAACSQGPDDPLRTAGETELLPNIEAFPAEDLSLEYTDEGKTLLRFDTTTWNSGDGALELFADEPGEDESSQSVYQRVYLDGGGSTEKKVGEFKYHEEHEHFHLENYAVYTLQPVDAPGGSERQGHKTSFCIMDTDRIDHKLPGAPKRAVYTACDDDVQGMSVGWGDTYQSDLAGQSIDVSDLDEDGSSGTYRLVIEADPKNHLEETNDGDNTSETLLDIDFEAGTVEVVEDTSDDSDDDTDDGGGSGNGGGNGNCPHC